MRRPHARSVAVGVALVVAILGGCAPSFSTAAADRTVRVLASEPTTLDPAAQGDGGTAAVVAQLFETLTAFDPDLQLRPALAQSWRIEEDGRRIVFTLRPRLSFSDGTPLRASDVVRSWLRVIDPGAPSPLASLLSVVRGADDYLAGRSVDPSTVGLVADDAGGTVTVDLVRPSSDFVEVVASPTFAIVPPGIGSGADLRPGSGFVASGGYRAIDASGDRIVLRSNPNYWAGRPEISTIELLTDIGGQSPVELFESGDLDYTSIFDADATWVAYEPGLGPQLREVPALTTTYYGFDTTKPPFDDVKVRQAFAQAVDWRRIARLQATAPDAPAVTSMVPPGIPGRSDQDFLPAYDPAKARSLLAEAGYPDGAGFPPTTFMTTGGGADAAVLDEIKRELGIDLAYETMDFNDYYDRLDDDPPAMWSLGWIADYPGRNDFLGVLLGTGASANYGGYSSTAFDDAIAEAGAAGDPAAATAAYDHAETIVQQDVPVIPFGYGTGWSLSRDGLLGASENGLGIVRMAGLAWAD
jgi:oligopeptide transport system substrate-binding protein